MDKPIIHGVTMPAMVALQQYERYLPTAFDESLSIVEKMNMTIEYMHKLGKVTEDVVRQWNEVMEWILNEGLEDVVLARLEKWYEEGKFADLVIQVIDALKEQGVSVKTYGAVGDGKTDDIVAFEKALASGFPVYIPYGNYKVSRGIKLPSNTVLLGAGIDNAVVSWLDSAPMGESLMYNENITNGNENIIVSGFTLDGNARRFGNPNIDPSGGSRDSTLTFRASKNVNISKIKTINSLLHGIDITCGGLDYVYTGDGTVAPNPSRNVYIGECDTSDFGDDGITTHHSEYLVIVNNYSHDARRRLNNNGIEIDDGSRHVMLANNRTERCYAGIEIKAHETAPAPYNVIITGHMSREDVRSYNFRHIGHHSDTDPDTKSARNIVAQNLSSINPNNSRGFQGGSTPRVVSLSAYVGVVISGVSAYTDDPVAFTEPVIAVQFKARNVNISDVVMTGFTHASDGIYVVGGGRRADSVNINNVVALDSGKRVVSIGGSIQNTNVSNVSAINTGKVAGAKSVIYSTNSSLSLQGVSNDGYPHVADIAGDLYTEGLNILNGGFRASSSSSGKIHENGAVLASTSSSSAEVSKSAVIASSASHVTGEYGAILGSLACRTWTGNNNIILGSSNCIADGNRNSIISSFAVKDSGSYKVNGGFGDLKTDIDGTQVPQTKNLKWQLDSLNGNIRASGSVTGAQVWADYAEYFESENGEAIPTGTLVTLIGTKIKPASTGDKIIGIISETAGVVLGEASWSWKDEFLKNEFGGLIMQEQTVIIDTVDESGKPITERITEMMPVKNPDYDDSIEYTSREERPEWNIVGLIGQMYVRVDESVEIGQGISPVDGIATKGDTGIVMEITRAFSASKGYGVAKILFK